MKKRQSKKAGTKDTEHRISDLMSSIRTACQVVSGNGMVREDHLLTYNDANSIQTALYGDDISEMIHQSILGADQEVLIQTFAWEPNTPAVKKINSALKSVLERKRKEENPTPLKVFVLVDERGRLANLAMRGHRGQNWPADPASLGLINEQGLVEVHTGVFHHNSAAGTHAKTVVVDNQVLIITGANFQSSNFGHQPAYDGALKIVGPIAQAARDDFCAIWRHDHNQQTGEKDIFPKDELQVDYQEVEEEDLVPMMLTTRPPSRSGLKAMENSQNQAFLAAIQNAGSEICIITPNLNAPFVKKALIDFVLRGGKLNLILGKGFNDRRESLPSGGGSNQETVNKLLEQTAECGGECNIRWYSLDGENPVVGNVAGAAHLKFMAMDGQVIIFGNANLDNVSTRNLHETNVLVDDARVTKRLTQEFFMPVFEKSIEACREGSPKSVMRISGLRNSLGKGCELEIVKIKNEGQGFRTLYLKKPLNLKMQPGQYCEVRSGKTVTKFFKHSAKLAIASGTHDEYLMITGRPSKKLSHPNRSLGREESRSLELTVPLGTGFPIEELNGRPLILIGGGSGITALRAMINSLSADADVRIVYSAKSEKDLLYRDDIEEWNKNPNNHISLTKETNEKFHHGRFTDYILDMEIPENAMVFICGPTGLVKETAKQLCKRGVPQLDIYCSLPVTAQQRGPVFRSDHPMVLGDLTLDHH